MDPGGLIRALNSTLRFAVAAVLTAAAPLTARANCARAQQMAQQCTSEGQQTMQTCDANQDPGLQQANQRGAQLNSQLNVSQNIQKACAETKDFNQQFNQAMQNFKQKCDQAQERCNNTCDQAMSAASSCPQVMGQVQQGKQQCTEAQARVEQTTRQQREAQNNKQEALVCQDNSQGGQGGGGPLAQTPDSTHMVSDCSDPAKAQSEPTCICRWTEGSSSPQCQKRDAPMAVSGTAGGGSPWLGDDGVTADRPARSADMATAAALAADGVTSAGYGGTDGAGSSASAATSGSSDMNPYATVGSQLASTPGQAESELKQAALAKSDSFGGDGAGHPAGQGGLPASSEEDEAFAAAAAAGRQPASAADAEKEEPVAMHGPNANMFEEVHGRYTRLLDTLISD